MMKIFGISNHPPIWYCVLCPNLLLQHDIYVITHCSDQLATDFVSTNGNSLHIIIAAGAPMHILASKAALLFVLLI